jgi:hypothetical protein
MTQQTEMFLRLVELGEVPMAPNANGLFTVDQVAALASKRGCSIHKAGDITIEIKHPGQGRGQWKHAKIMATDRGLWHPVQIFRACREANGKPHYEVDSAKTKIQNPGGLNEMLIAQILAADGVKPYLTRRTEHIVCHAERANDFWAAEPADNFQRYIRSHFPGHCGDIRVMALPGDYSWSMIRILFRLRRAFESSECRRALYALSEAGLINLTFQHRFGRNDNYNKFEWLPAAYLASVERKETFHHDDSQFFCDLMAVS